MRARAIPGQRYLGVSLIREIARPGAAIPSRVPDEMSLPEKGDEHFRRILQRGRILERCYPTNLGETVEFEYQLTVAFTRIKISPLRFFLTHFHEHVRCQIYRTKLLISSSSIPPTRIF